MRHALLRANCFALLLFVGPIALSHAQAGRAKYPVEDGRWADGLRKEAATLGKPAWRPMLQYDVDMHVRSTHPATPPFAYPWEDNGIGYAIGPGFGHWDIVHEILDVLPTAPDHARQELLNDVNLQLPSGFLPGLYWMRGVTAEGDAAKFSPTQSHPPVWVAAADDYIRLTHDKAITRVFFDHAKLQIAWFERERRAQPDGFLYLDILTRQWESGVDEGVRFDATRGGVKDNACIDATSQVYQMYVYAARWAGLLGEDPAPYQRRAAELRKYIQTQMWDAKDGFFYDAWAIKNPALKAHAFEGMWPVVVGAATPEQARRVIDEWLLRKDRFFTPHPIATVARDDPKFELRMWRGPAWNSMTYWAARGCMRYGRPDAARKLLEAALDDSAAQFARTGTIWEFYNPLGGHPEDVKRKPQTSRNEPFSDYLGHDPLLAMARMWEKAGQRGQ